MIEALNPGKSTPSARTRRTDASARAAEALELRLSGLGYAEIAERLGYSDKSGAWRAVEGELREIRREKATEAVDIDITRLDKVLNAVWQKALDGDPVAIDRVLKVLDRRAKYFDLDGRADSTSAELRAAQQLAFAEVLERLAEIKHRMDGRLAIAIGEEIARLSQGLPVRDSHWEGAIERLDAFDDDGA